MIEFFLIVLYLIVLRREWYIYNRKRQAKKRIMECLEKESHDLVKDIPKTRKRIKPLKG